MSNSKKHPKRRPGREHHTEDTDVEREAAAAHDEESHAPEHEDMSESSHDTWNDTDKGHKIEISFWGSEILRAKFPKPFDVAEAVATDWVNDGKFDSIPLGHPMAEFIATKGLQKAKETERKILESPVTEKVATKAFEVGMRAQSQIRSIKQKLNIK